MKLRLVKEPLDSEDYVFELKHDDFRAVVYLQNHDYAKDGVRLQANCT